MKRFCTGLLCLGFTALTGMARAAINVSGTMVYEEPFNTLPTSSVRSEVNWTDNVSIRGFYLHRSNAPAGQTNLAGTLDTAGSRPYIADGSVVATTAPNFHGFLNLGVFGQTDRCLGSSPTTTDTTTNWSGGEL